MISVAIPVYNEEEIVHILHSRVSEVMNGIGEEWEVVYVNDGSKDATLKLLLELQATDPHVVVVDLSRNWGHMGALSAGMQTARGDAVVLMDGDLQDPPEVIPEMVDSLAQGRQGGERGTPQARGQPQVPAGAVRLVLPGAGRAVGFSDPAELRHFRPDGPRRRWIPSMRLQEYNRYLPGLRAWIGYPTAIVTYDRKHRVGGEGKLSFVSRIKYALDAITSFSYKPLRLSFAIGIPAMFLALMAVVALALGGHLTATAAVIAAVFFMGGVQLFCVGVLAEYIGRIYDEVRRRPLSLINAVHRAQAVPSSAGQEVLPAAA